MSHSPRRRLPNVAAVVVLIAVASTSAAGQTTERLTVNSSGQPAPGYCGPPVISADGRFAVFTTASLRLTPRTDWFDIFIRDRVAGTTDRITTGVDGGGGNGNSWSGSLSADNRFVAFYSFASNLVAGDTNYVADCFVHDRLTGATALVDVSPSGGIADRATLSGPALSSDGRYVAFSSEATNLVPGDANRRMDLFVRDLWAGTTTRESLNFSGAETSDRASFGPAAISAGGRFLCFLSNAASLVDGVPAGRYHVFVRDRATGVTQVVSTTPNSEDDAWATSPSMSDDGRYVAFAGSSTQLVPNDTNGPGDVFVRDLATGTIERVNISSTGEQANGQFLNGGYASLSPDGRFVGFWSDAPNLVPGAGAVRFDLFVHDRLSGLTTRENVSSTGGDPMDAYHLGQVLMAPSLSRGAGIVAFFTLATGLVPDDRDSFPDDYARVRLTISSVVPAAGSTSGGDLVRVLGRAFSTEGTTELRFGDRAATVLAVTSESIDAITPPGAGIVDVSVTGPTGSTTLIGGFRYVEALLAARYGDVNVARGDREDVLLVNAVTGDPTTREVTIGLGQPIAATMLSPSSRRAARFAAYAWARAPLTSTLTTLPQRLGTMVFAPPFAGGSPPVVWNNVGRRRSLGAPTLLSREAPSSLFRSAGGSVPFTVTIQGLIEDDGSQSPTGFSVTNAVILRAR